MRFLFHAVADQFNPLGWSFYHFIWQGMLVAALYSAGCLVCGADARRRHALACFFLGVSLVLPIWQIWMILVRHHGLALGNGPPERLLDWMTWAALLWIGVAGAISLRTLAGAVILRRQWLADATEDAECGAADQLEATPTRAALPDCGRASRAWLVAASRDDAVRDAWLSDRCATSGDTRARISARRAARSID
jgi:hypothetical protein